MYWHKLGQVFCPDGSLWWAKRRAYLPTPVVHDGFIRVYYSALDVNQVGRIGYVDLDMDLRVLRESKEPVLFNGEAGLFDAHGVAPCCVLGDWLFYQGFERTEGAPAHIFAGLAKRDGDGFRKFVRTSILPRTDVEPWARSSPFVVEDGGLYRLWYTSWVALKVIEDNPLFANKHQATYGIREDVSQYVDKWTASCPRFALLPLSDDDEFGLARPWVVKDKDVWRMWYSIRSEHTPYRIGYAESKSGWPWQRKDEEAGITWSEEGWDSKMICFAAVVDTPEGRLMFYNGNGHGETGFGVAVLEDFVQSDGE